MTLRPVCCVAALVLALGAAHAAFLLPPLPFPPSATEPVISASTNQIHHDGFHAEHVSRLNAALTQAPQFANLSLSALLSKVGTGEMPPAVENEVRNQGGGTWNHDLLWLVLAPTGSPPTDPNTAINSSLKDAIVSSFGSVQAMTDKLITVSKLHFGDGWTWLIVKSDGGLDVLDTNKQDNPLMSLPGLPRGIPIFGLDLWEHNFVCQYGNDKYTFLDKSPQIINWTKVSENYDAARQGNLAVLIGEKYELPQ